MFNIIKNLSFTFSPRALLSVVPTVVSNEILEFLFSLGFSDYLHLVLATSSHQYFQPCEINNSRKQKNYINFENFIYKKLNCLTVLVCKTTKTHYSVVKELNVLLLYMRQKLKKTFNLLSEFLYKT